MGHHSLLQKIFLTQGSNPGLSHCRQIFYCLSHQGSPRILEWVAYPFSRGSSQPRNRTGSSAWQVDSLPAELSGKTNQLHRGFKLNSQKVLVAQSCLTLCDPMDCSPLGSSVHGILQARILEWVAISFSRGSSQPRYQTQVSHIAGRCFNL